MIVYRSQKGFTLIEMLIAMLIGSIMLMGLGSLFLSQVKTAASVNSRSAAINDLLLASHIMQKEIRSSKATCWNGTDHILHYQPIDSTKDLDENCNTKENANGFFALDYNNSLTSLCWQKPENLALGCQEFIRNLPDTLGFSVSPSSNSDLRVMRQLSINVNFIDTERNTKPVGASFKVWPRNQ